MQLDKESLAIRYAQTRDRALRDQIVETYKPLVEYIARKLSFNRHDVDDLVQVGIIGLLRALERFDPSKAVDFSTFATPNIIGEIKHYFRDKSNILKIPRKLREINSKIRAYINEAKLNGRSPTVAEIAKALELTVEKVLESMEAGKSSSVISLDSPATTGNGQSDYGNQSSLLDSIGVESREDFYLNKETLRQAMKFLDNREKKIIYLRFYNGMSQNEIAEEMNLSQVHISRLLNNALKTLRKSFKNH